MRELVKSEWESELQSGQCRMHRAWIAERICLALAYTSAVFLFAELVMLHWDILITIQWERLF